MLIRKNSFLSSASLAVMALSLSAVATPAFAGFEWTPPEKAAPAPLPPQQTAPSQIPMDSSALPEVGDFEMPAEEQPAPRPYPAQSGKLNVIEAAPPREQIPVNEQEPEPEAPVVMSAPVTPGDSDNQSAPEPFPLTETHQGQDAILPAPAAETEVAPAPVPTGLSINPYPLEGGQATPPAEVASAPPSEQIEWQGGHEVIEGFGSDMPLALALQQVVPARYAFSFGKGVNAGHLVSWEGGRPWDQVLNDMIRPLNLHAGISGNVVKIVSENAPAMAEPEPVAQPDQDAALEPLPMMDAPAEEQQASSPAAEEMKLEPVSDKEAKDIAKEAKAVQDDAEIAEAVEQQPAPAPEPVQEAKAEPEIQGKKVSQSRNVILDPGESKPLEPANKAVKKSSEKASQSEDTAKLLVPAPEASAPSEAALESARTEPASQESPQLNQPRIWEAKRGSSLKETLDSWSKQANVSLNWQAQDDVKLNSDILISGTFDNAIKVLFAQAVKKGPTHTLKTDGSSAELTVADQTASG